MHHIISDGWSVAILIKEFVALYEAYSNNLNNPLKPLNIQYSDYSVWQKNYLNKETLNKKLKYFKDNLKDIEPLNLPTAVRRAETITTFFCFKLIIQLT